MDRQPRAGSQSESAFFYDGASMSAPVPGTIARGELIDDSPYFTGKDTEGNFVASNPLTIDESVLARGEDRFAIYCAPCHSIKGTGKGVLYKVGKVPTPSYREERVVALTEGQIFDVITNGKGLMPPYRWPIPVEDRWAIVAHVRVLQQGSRR
jgi:mono/diheme cytochrome c family protein